MGCSKRAQAASTAFLLACAACASLRAPAQERLVDVRSLDSTLVVDIRYATADNFTGKVLYPASRCLLRESVARRLLQVQTDLRPRGLGLKVWDCYRPLSVQRKLWDLVKDPRYVADPKKGSRHNRGAAVDVTLIQTANETELAMPTGYDDFSERAHRDDMKAPSEALRNREALEHAMKRRGFRGLPTEWWHFDASGWERYPLSDVPLEGPATGQ